MKKRPALLGALTIAGGIIVARGFQTDWRIFAIAAFLFLLLSFIELIPYRKRNGRESFATFGIFPLLFFSAACAYSIDQQLTDGHHITHYLNTHDSLYVRCKVIDQPRLSNGKTTLQVSMVSLSNETDSVPVDGKAIVSIYPNKRTKEIPAPILYGSMIAFKSVLQSPGDERNPGEFSYKQYLALNNIYATLSVFGYSNVAISETREPNWFFEYIIFPSKDFIVRTIQTAMKGDDAYFLIGLLIGDRTDLSDDIKNAFMNTGTIHVLAVSGSHVVLVAEIIFVVLGLLRFSRRPKILIAIAALIYYMYLTGATPSVVRATIMIIVVYVGKFFEERTDIYNVLGVSAVFILLIEPKQLFDVGFQLSFSAVFSIVYFYPKLNVLIPKIPEPFEEFKIMNWLWQLFAVSLAAQIGTLPFTAYYFGKVSIVSLFANLVVVPLVGVIVTVGLSGAILGLFSIWISSCFSEVNNVISYVTLNFVKWAEQVPYAIVNTSTFGLRETVMYSALIGILFNGGNRQLQKTLLFTALCAANIFVYGSFFQLSKNDLRVTFLDVGQGDGAVIQFPTGETMVIDAGPKTPGFDAGERTVAPFLRKKGISTIDLLITSHPHADHLGGVPFLMRQFTVKQTIDAGQRAQTNLFYEYTMLDEKINHRSVHAGMILPFGGAHLYFLHPTKSFIDMDSTNGYSDLNGSSVVFKLQYGTTSMLFTGDAELEAEEQMENVYGNFLDSDLLKAGHHGSSTSSSEHFISLITPKEVVVSVAKFNKFRHPSKKVIERFKSFGAFVHRTDVEGAVIFESNGETLSNVIWREE